jgi:pimeloyl-ACP methyl ester carboxylesterase
LQSARSDQHRWRTFVVVRALIGVLLVSCAGCLILPRNVGVHDRRNRELVREAGGASFFREDGSDGPIWLEISRVQESGTVGGYLSEARSGRRALVVILPGASSLQEQGMQEKALSFHHRFAQLFQNAGYLTWTLVVRECGTPYGQGDLRDLVAVVDWLNSGGNEVLGVDRVYVVGYSSGATLAILLNRKRAVHGVVGIGGITEPTQFQSSWLLYRFIASLFPRNTGLCQLRSTLDFYGKPSSPAWDALDSVHHVQEFHSPMLLIHGARDFVYKVDNLRSLQRSYDRQRSAGVALPEMEFFYLPEGDHFTPHERPDVQRRILAFLERCEHAAAH